MAARKKKTAPAADALVAKAAIAIEGKHFDAGAVIEGVSDEELGKVVRSRRVVTFAEFSGTIEADVEEEGESEEGNAEESSTEDQAEA